MRSKWAFVMGWCVWAAGAAPSVQAEELHHDDESGEDQEHHDDDVDEIKIECKAINEFGYVAQVKGKLELSGLAQYGSFDAGGTLEVKTWFFDEGEPEAARSVNVRGTIQASYMLAEVRSGADDLKAMMLTFQSPMSQVESKDGTYYQTDCTDSDVELPEVADLVPLEALKFTASADGAQRAQISVLNNGTAAVLGPAVQVRIAGLDLTGTLVQSFGGGNTLEPLQQGSIDVDLPAGTLARCSEYELTVDLDQRVQFGPFDPFSNDTGRQTTPCLRWTTTITEESLGMSPDPLISGKSLGAIVSSEVVGRTDGNLCSACHRPAGPTSYYHAPSGTISPDQNIEGWTWSAAGGWADQFRAQSIKPEYLKQAFLRWQLDGAL